MDGDAWKFALESDADDGDSQQVAWSGRDCTLFLVDCGRSMANSDESGKDGFSALCLDVLCRVYRRKCSACSSDYLATVLFNTEKTDNEHGFPSICVLHRLSLPDATKVKELEHLSEEYSKFQSSYGSAKASIDEVFWLCSMLFGGCKFRRRYSSVFLFTNCDSPHESDNNLKKRAAQRIRDLKEKGVHVDLLPVGSGPFAYDNFYRVIFDDEEVPDNPPEATTDSDRLLDRVFVNYDRKWRTFTSVDFQIMPGFEIAVSFYSTTSVANMPSAIKLDGRTNSAVTTATNFFDPMTGEKLYRFEVCKYQTYAGRRIAMTFQEVEQMAHFCRPGLVLLGFLPAGRLKAYHFVRNSLFMYPDETVTKGSSKFFIALLTKCLERKVTAICRLAARQNTSPRLVALLPQAETYDANAAQMESPGFHVVFLPYADDLRDLSSVANVQREVASDKLVQEMKSLVGSLKPCRSIGQIHNPALQKHQKVVEAFILDREKVETVEDETLANTDRIDEAYGPLLASFDRLMKAESANDTRKGKRKAESTDDPPIDLRVEAKNGLLGKRTIAALRNACNVNGVPLRSGQMRKAEIVEAIANFYAL
uniref:ATP-dependent DNA helicase 2 subunit 1 n=1 Tax=Trichuris muris TaxID=70415 RepID=A0A5S6R635_TRIMR